MGEGLEDDGGAERLGELVHDEVGRRTAQGEGREARPHVVAGTERGRLLGDDAAMDGFGDGHELHLAPQDDERESVRTRGLDDDGRRVAVVRPEFEEERRQADLHETADEGGERGRVVGPGRAGRQEQLAAVQQPGHTRAVRDVHPPHARVEGGAADEDVGHARLDSLERQHLADGRKALVRARTIRTDRWFFATFRHRGHPSASATLGLATA